MTPTAPDLAELRRLAEAATQGPWAARYGVSWEARVCATTGSLADVNSTANAELIVAAVNALPGLLDAAAERDALADRLDIAEAGLDRVAVAMGCGDEVDGRGVYRDDVDGMIEYATTLRQAARDHDECPVLCAEHDGPEAWEWPMSCQDCRGSGMAGPSAIDFIDGVVPDNLAHPGECESCAGSGRDCNSIHNLITMDDARQMAAVVLDDLAVAEARMADVRALHFGEYVEDEDQNRCFECGDEWPCPTIRALGGAES